MTDRGSVDIIKGDYVRVSIKNLIVTAQIAAKEAGEVILNIYDSDFKVEFKNDRSPLTIAQERKEAWIKEATVFVRKPEKCRAREDAGPKKRRKR